MLRGRLGWEARPVLQVAHVCHMSVDPLLCQLLVGGIGMYCVFQCVAFRRASIASTTMGTVE
jgi:hypothetical protein